MKPLYTFCITVATLITLAFVSPDGNTVTHEGDIYQYSQVEYQTETLCGVSDNFYNGGAGIYGNFFLDKDVPKDEIKVVSIQIKTYKLKKCIHPIHK